MAKTVERTILLKGRGYRLEKVAGGTITPGHLVKLNSSDQLVVHSLAGGKWIGAIAVEDDHNGKDIDDNYSANDYVQAEVLGRGCYVNGLVAAGAAALVIGDLVEPAGDGTVRKVVTLTGSLTGTPDGALADITFNSTWSSAQADEINVNFEEIQLVLNTMAASAIGVVTKAVNNSGGGSPARCQFMLI